MFGIADLIKAQSRIAIMINVIFSSEAMMSPVSMGLGTLKKEQTHIIMKLEWGGVL